MSQAPTTKVAQATKTYSQAVSTPSQAVSTPSQAISTPLQALSTSPQAASASATMSITQHQGLTIEVPALPGKAKPGYSTKADEDKLSTGFFKSLTWGQEVSLIFRQDGEEEKTLNEKYSIDLLYYVMPGVRQAIDAAQVDRNDVATLVFLDHPSSFGFRKVLYYVEYAAKRGQLLPQVDYHLDPWYNCTEIAVASQALGISFLLHQMVDRFKEMAFDPKQSDKFEVQMSDLKKMWFQASIKIDHWILDRLFTSIASAYLSDQLINEKQISRWVNYKGNAKAAAEILRYQEKEKVRRA